MIIQHKQFYLFIKNLRNHLHQMNSIILKDLLKHKIRKEILKNNKKINHKSFVKAMQLPDKIPFLMKYHKKKLVFLLVLSIITWNYSLHQKIYDWIITIRPPHKIILGMIVDMPEHQESTVLELNVKNIRISQQSKDILSKIYYEAEKYLYFGVGRKFLFEVYRKLGLLQTQEKQKFYWQKSQFYKKRNQLASGVGFAEHMLLFQQSLKQKRTNNKDLTQQQFRQNYLKAFIETAKQIMKWEKQFNLQRQKEYLKNTPGLSQAKKNTISDILKQNPQISIQALEEKLQKMGLRGLNISQRFFYHKNQQVWLSMKQMNIKKKLSHPTISFNLQQKYGLERQLKEITETKNKITLKSEQDLKQYQEMYQKQLL